MAEEVGWCRAAGGLPIKEERRRVCERTPSSVKGTVNRSEGHFHLCIPNKKVLLLRN